MYSYLLLKKMRGAFSLKKHLIFFGNVWLFCEKDVGNFKVSLTISLVLNNFLKIPLCNFMFQATVE